MEIDSSHSIRFLTIFVNFHSKCSHKTLRVMASEECLVAHLKLSTKNTRTSSKCLGVDGVINDISNTNLLYITCDNRDHSSFHREIYTYTKQVDTHCPKYTIREKRLSCPRANKSYYLLLTESRILLIFIIS